MSDVRNVKLTYDDFLLFPDDGQRHELIAGEHYVTPSPNIRRRRIFKRLLVLIGIWLQEHPLGEVFGAPLDVRFSMFDVVEPNLLYVSNDRAAELLAGQHVMGAPDLVVEIGSPSTRQRDETVNAASTRTRASSSTGWSIQTSMSSASIAATVIASLGLSSCRARRVTSSTSPLFPGLDIALARVFGD